MVYFSVIFGCTRFWSGKHQVFPFWAVVLFFYMYELVSLVWHFLVDAIAQNKNEKKREDLTKLPPVNQMRQYA